LRACDRRLRAISASACSIACIIISRYVTHSACTAGSVVKYSGDFMNCSSTMRCTIRS
jgi:hypothetical protein